MNEETVSNRGRILVADDDPHIAGLITLYLEKSGYCTVTAADGEQAARLLEGNRNIDLAVLDIMMPGPDGLELMRALRRRGDLPVIIVSARGSDIDKVAALHLGADDYVTKPFSPSELVARVEAVMRRAARGVQENAPSLLRAGSLVIDIDARLASRAGEQLALTPKEFDLLAVLCRLEGVSLTREKLLDLVWGSNFYGIRTVDLHVARLRKKLSGAGVTIETVWGSGYRLVNKP